MLFIRSYQRFSRRFLSVGIFILALAVFVTKANAVDQTDASCIGCHTTRGLSTRLPAGEILPLTIKVEDLSSSVHKALHCTGCHSEIQKFPHPKLSANDHREFQIASSKRCQSCHVSQSKDELTSNHARAMAAGNLNAAICVDCHGSHDVENPRMPRYKISTTCGRCHGAIYEQYIGSAHGKALLEDSNPDVPVCSDCHSAHKQENPTTQEFRLKSPKLCAKCHADAKLMRKYNISPDVFNTYVADFHGMTVTLFKKEAPGQRVNTAVCTDCHGIHDIRKVSEETASVIKENLLAACRRCHPDATASFPSSWVGHFPPTRDRYPLVYYVNLFYRYLIPITIGGMLLFVLIDAASRVARRLRKNRS